MHTIAQLISTFSKYTSPGEVCLKLNEHLFELGINAHTQYLPTEDLQNRRFLIEFHDPRQASLVNATLPKFKSLLFGYSTLVFCISEITQE